MPGFLVFAAAQNQYSLASSALMRPRKVRYISMWYTSTKGRPMQVMPVIHARAKSEEAAFAMVMLVPVVATTRVGNIEAANSTTKKSADALLARNGRRSLQNLLEI